jgi:hypothetical protein
LFTLIWMAIKKCVTLQLGVISDSEMTNKKQGGLPARKPNPSGALLLVTWKSYMTPR